MNEIIQSADRLTALLDEQKACIERIFGNTGGQIEAIKVQFS